MEENKVDTGIETAQTSVETTPIKKGNKKVVAILLALFLVALMFLCCIIAFVGSKTYTTLLKEMDENVSEDPILDYEAPPSNGFDTNQPPAENDNNLEFEMPDGITMYPGVRKIISLGNIGSGSTFASFSGAIETGSESDVYEYYVNQLEAKGWSITSETLDYGQTVVAAKGEYQIIISSEGSNPTINTITITR